MLRQGLEAVRDADCLERGCPKEVELMLIQRRDSLYLKKGDKDPSTKIWEEPRQTWSASRIQGTKHKK